MTKRGGYGSKVELVLVALSEVGGEADLETIALRAWQMFPKQFCWKLHPEFPDKDVVRIHLSNAKHDARGAMVVDADLRRSNSMQGRLKRYALTPLGMQLVVAVGGMLKEKIPTGTSSSLEHRRLILPVQQSDAFAKFNRGVPLSEIGRESFLRAFKLFGDASAYIISSRLTRTQAVLLEYSGGEERDRLLTFMKDGRLTFEL